MTASLTLSSWARWKYGASDLSSGGTGGNIQSEDMVADVKVKKQG